MHISAGRFCTPKERIQPLLGEGEPSLSRAHFKLQQVAQERKAVQVVDPLFQINIPWTETQVTD